MKHDEYLLIEKAKTGNKAALTELVNMYSPQIYNLGLRMMRNKTDAEDILQDTFLVMVRKLNTFEGRSSLYTWLYRIAMNLCLEKLNDKHRTPITASIDDPDYEGMADFQAVLLPDFTEETLSDSQFRLYLEQALEDLNDKLKYRDQSFDAIVCINVLYLLQKPRETLIDFFRVLKEGGKLIISIPKYNFNYSPLLQRHFLRVNGIKKIRDIILFSFILVLIFFFEFIITKRERKGRYHRFNKSDILRLFQGTNFRNLEISDCYAGQNFLIIAEK